MNTDVDSTRDCTYCVLGGRHVPGTRQSPMCALAPPHKLETFFTLIKKVAESRRSHGRKWWSRDSNPVLYASQVSPQRPPAHRASYRPMILGAGVCVLNVFIAIKYT